MWKVILGFLGGYWLGSGGKLPPKPNVTVGSDGSLIISPPQQNPATVPYAPPPTQGSYQLPAGYSVDAQGNVYNQYGQMIASASQWAAQMQGR